MKSKFLIAALFISATFFAQDFEMGEVSVKELKEKQHPLEPSAPAAILFKKGTTSFDFDNQGHWILVTDVMVRLKIYNESGYKYANVEIPYYIGGGDKEEVEIEDAFTYNLINGKAERTKLTDESKFSQEVNSKWKIKKIAFPNVREGSVVEYHYTIKSPQFTSFPTWYFQYDIPVNFIEYGAYIPLFFVYNRILSPYVPINEVQENKKVTKMYVNTNSRGGYGQATSLGQNETGGLSFYEIRRTYTAKDVPSLNDESYVDNINNYRSFVKHELASAKMPNEPEKKYATDWNTVAKSIYESEDFGDKLGQKSYFEKDIDEVLKGKTQRNEIIEAVFNHVKNRMAWNGNYGYNCVNGINKAYEEKAGNVAEINLMLIAMLRYAGITANPILVSTRSNGHVSFVNRDEFNYAIAGVEAQNGVVYLDATSKNAMPDILPVRALNISGRIIRENRTSAEVSLIPEKKSRESTTIIASLNTDGSVTGQVKAQYYDYNAYLYREKYADLSEESRLEKLESAIGADVSNYATVSNDFSKPVTEDFSFSDNNLSDVINGKIYISPMLVYTVSGNPFKQDKRVYPVDFVFPQQERYAININIPDGYTVESLPEPIVLTTGDNIAEFKFNIAVTQANQIQVIATKEINYARINPDYYETLKEFYNNMINKQTEKIVLAKK